MECKRQFTRVQGYSASCILMKPDGSSYQATLENISIGGALIRVGEGAPEDLHVGDRCTVTLGSGSASHSSKYSCEVAWYRIGQMGIQFITAMDQ